MASLNALAAESVAHGLEITVEAQGPAGAGAYVTLAEIKVMEFETTQNEEAVPILGTRRDSYRLGRFKVSGKITAYYVNQAVHSMWFAASQPTSAGSSSTIYESAIPLTRYNIHVRSTNASTEPKLFVNVLFKKDVSKWDAEKLSEEEIEFVAEDILDL